MKITGAHAVIYSTDAEADRAFFRDVVGFDNVDAGDGWLIFALPPSEVAVHPAEESGRHELYLMCDDAEAFVSEMSEKGFGCDEPKNVGWGVLTRFTLPGGGTVGVYEPRHARP
jgi:catechol 2,3-dioxygenase-like lactoylglutathione lyase family enzyme